MESVKFGEKIKAARKAAGLTQTELAAQVGVTMRTIQLYEANDRQPKNAGVMLKLAKALSVPLDYFMSKEELEHMREQEQFIRDATEQYGTRGRAQAKLLLNQTSALFAGGELSDEDRDAFFETMTEIYFDAKKKSKRYGHSTEEKL